MGGLVEWRCGHLPPSWNIPYAFFNNIINSKRFRDIMVRYMRCPQCKQAIAMFKVTQDGALECQACDNWTYVCMDSNGRWYLE